MPRWAGFQRCSRCSAWVPPEVQSLADLRGAVAAVGSRAPIVGTYNYGLMSMEAVGWVGQALRGLAAPNPPP